MDLYKRFQWKIMKILNRLLHNSIITILKNSSLNNTAGCLFPYVGVNNGETDLDSILKNYIYLLELC